jgi:eukaryotic-like serine/threonine-protein kinase
VAAAVTGGIYYRGRRIASLTDKDTIIVSDFTNTTGDAVFDDTLKQGLSVQLEQSPFLELISDRRLNDSLKLMGRPAGDRLTPEVTREVCVRTGSKAMLAGSIASLGSEYVIGLKAVNCDTEDLLAEMQEQAKDKEAVLNVLDTEATSMRTKLGESLSSVQKYTTPLIDAATPSLEALKAYSLAMKTRRTKGEAASLPFARRAVELDPNFAIGYAGLSSTYDQLGAAQQAAECSRKAYELRDRASEIERIMIETNYHEVATRNLEKAMEAIEQWHQDYPRDLRPVRELGFMYSNIGKHEKALDQAQALSRAISPTGSPGNSYYIALGNSYLNLNRLDEAHTLERRRPRHPRLQAGQGGICEVVRDKLVFFPRRRAH